MKIIKKTVFVITFLFIGLLVYYFYPDYKLPKNAQVDSIVVYKSKRANENDRRSNSFSNRYWIRCLKAKFAGDEAQKSVILSVVDRLKVLIIMI